MALSAPKSLTSALLPEQIRSPLTVLPARIGPYAPARRVYRSLAVTCVLFVSVTSPLNLVPAVVTSRVVPAIWTAPFIVLPNSCIASAPVDRSTPSIVLSVATSDAPDRTVTTPVTIAFSRQVTPLLTVTLSRGPVTVRVHSGDPPGSTVAR